MVDSATADGVRSGGAKRLQAALDAYGLDLRVVELSASTRTSKEASDAIGCTVAQIAKSVIFRAKASDRPVLVIASGVNRIDEKKVAALVGEEIGKADADFVREQTGYVIGGVPPVGHRTPTITLLDEDLARFDEIWAAAGSPHAVFRLTPADLTRMTGTGFADVRKG